MAFEKRVPLRGSERLPVGDAEEVGEIDPRERMDATIYLRRRGGRAPHQAGRVWPRVTYTKFADKYGAEPEDMALVERFVHQSGLTVLEASLAKRRVRVNGTAEAMESAFGTKLARFRMGGNGPEVRMRTGALTIP